ncbi:uncharacterized protein JCM10292_001115 [Rhodotorula paludigena]|uniref:uncharacterized protein n=1 Tax=Rhodotorula paludigena TaxID=86838 RepID=UPI003177B540
MRPFVVRLDPTPFDPATAASAPGDSDREHLRLTWNAWSGKARKLLDQNSRIENLFWRRWHMEQRHGPVHAASPTVASPHEDLYGLHASVEAHERRRATEDLEAFLRTTLHAAQPAAANLTPQPPTFNVLSQSSVPSAQQPAQANSQPPTIHAPQPQRVAFNPSPEWGYSPVPPSSQAAQSRIIATPSWTALIASPLQQHQQAPSASAGQSEHGQQGASTSSLQPPAGSQGLASGSAFFSSSAAHNDPFAAAANTAAQHGAFPFGIPSAPPTSVPSPGFTLPPTATVYNDLPSALSSAPSAAAPPAFFSSYGMYQPVVNPYPRFLTPSPEPSILGDLELELGPATGEFSSHLNGGGSVSAGSGTSTLDHVWRDLEGRGASSSSGQENSLIPKQEQKDPFEGMSLVAMRSRANSLEAVDRQASRFDIGGATGAAPPPGAADDAGALSLADQAAREVERAVQAQDAATAGGASATAKGKRKAKAAGGGAAGKKVKNAGAAAAAAASAAAAGGVALPGASPEEDSTGAGGAAGKLGATGKKNRNPHSTQLPGNGQRRLPKEEAGEGHEGPVCSHCGSITTPLWRRGPDDELLCNACGLYLKLHSKPRPKTFAKSNASRRSSNGAAAQAAASGVPPSCNNCGATSTPMWRKDQEGRLCCNACSLYYKLHKVNRPASLAQKRQAAAAAKANLAAAAAASASKDGEGSGSAPKAAAAAPAPSAQLPTPAASTEVTPTAAADMPAPPPPHPHLPPGYPPHLPHDPAMLGTPFMPLPPMWPPHIAPPGYPGGMPPMGLAPGQPYGYPPIVASPNPFAQTAWGALAYGIVSAAAAEEAGGPPAHGVPPQPGQPAAPPQPPQAPQQ